MKILSVMKEWSKEPQNISSEHVKETHSEQSSVGPRVQKVGPRLR